MATGNTQMDGVEEAVPFSKEPPKRALIMGGVAMFGLLSVCFWVGDPPSSVHSPEDAVYAALMGMVVSAIGAVFFVGIQLMVRGQASTDDLPMLLTAKDGHLRIACPPWAFSTPLMACTWWIGSSRECLNLRLSGERKRVIVVRVPTRWSRSWFGPFFYWKIGCGLDPELFEQWQSFLVDSGVPRKRCT